MATATAFLELNLESFDRAIASAKRSLGVLAGLFASYKSVKFLANQTNDALQFADAMWKVSRSIGNMDTGQLLLSQKALEQIGYSASAAQDRIRELVSAGLPLSAAFGGAKNYADALNSASKMWGNTAAVLTRAGDRFALVWDRLQAVGGKVREFFLGLTGSFLQPLQILLDKILTLDLASVGAKFGESLATAINLLNGAMQNGTLGEIIQTSFLLGMEYVKDGFAQAGTRLLAILELAGIAFNSAVVSINWGNLGLQILTTLGKGIVLIFEQISRLLLGIFDKFLSFLGAGEDEEENKRMGWKSTDEKAHDTFQAWQDSFPKVGPLLNANTSQIGPIMATALARTIDQLGSTLGTSPEAIALKARLSALGLAAAKTGEALAANAPGKPTGYVVKADPFKVIADSLARIGGGGGFIQVGMTIEAKNSILIARASQQTAANTAIIANKLMTPTAPSTLSYQP